MKKTIYLFPLMLVLGVFFALPDYAIAQGLVPCDGSDCSFCHFIALGQNVLNWIFGIVFIIFGVIAVVAGFGLVTSGGNQSKLDDAKAKLSNAVVGILIVFSAWLIVDTILKAVVPDEGNLSSVSGELGMWHSIDCDVADQEEPEAAVARDAAEDEDRSDRVATAWAATGDTIRECARDGARGCEEWVRIPIEERTVTVTRCARTTGTGECNRWVDIDNVEKRYCDPAGDSDPCESYICVQGECAE